MKLHARFFVVVLFPFVLTAQQRFPLRSATDSLGFALTDKEGKLALDLQNSIRQLSSSTAFPYLVGLNMDDADLVLDYKIKKIKKQFAYKVEVEILGPDGRPLSRELSETTEPEEGRKNQARQLRWMDATENALDFGQSYTLVFHKSLLSVVNCQGKRPAFGLKKQWPHYLVAGAGLAALGLGEYYRQEKEDYYTRYRNFWSNGDPLKDAQDSFDKADKNRKRAEDYTSAGLIILGADALFFAYRWWMVEKSQRVFDQYCNAERDLTWNLFPGINWTPGLQSSVGLTFQMQF